MFIRKKNLFCHELMISSVSRWLLAQTLPVECRGISLDLRRSIDKQVIKGSNNPKNDDESTSDKQMHWTGRLADGSAGRRRRTTTVNIAASTRRTAPRHSNVGSATAAASCSEAEPLRAAAARSGNQSGVFRPNHQNPHPSISKQRRSGRTPNHLWSDYHTIST